MHPLIIFDDGRAHLGPMTDLRASFEVRTGMVTTAARIDAEFPRRLAGYWVPASKRALVAERANAPVNQLPNDEIVMCVNGRWAMPSREVSLDLGHALAEQGTGDIVAAVMRRADAEYFLTTGELHERVRTRTVEKRVLYRFPWDILAMAKDAILHDIEVHRLLDAAVTPNVDVVGEHPIEVHETATVYPGVVLDAGEGPIVVHAHATIRSGAIVCGPVSIGPHSTVVDRALVKPQTVIGPWCKVAGEVGATIFQGYANKAHDGHLGDSWVGKWSNFGAGTTNSNLLNTYGEVTMRLEPDGARHRTGLTFLGAIVGDHAKFAINTRLMTGTVIGTGAMIATTAAPPTTVRRFAWLTDAGERTYECDKFIDVMQRVMARRSKTPGPAYLDAVRDLHAAVA